MTEGGILLDGWPATLADLSSIHEMAAVCWDRDGITDLVDRAAMWSDEELVGRAYPAANVRVWTRNAPMKFSSCDAYVCIGRSWIAAARFHILPEPRWVADLAWLDKQ